MADEKSRDFTIRIADWRLDRLALQRLREQVFIKEQGVPEELEWDGRDNSAIHLLAEAADGTPIATARLLPGGHIGHIAIIPEQRGSGLGSAMIEALLDIAAQRHLEEIFLNAPEQTLPFFLQNGFKARGPITPEGGVPHQLMSRTLEAKPLAATAYLATEHKVDESLEQISTGVLSETKEEIALYSRAAFRTATITLAAQARRKILIFSYDLENGIYDNQEMFDALKTLAIKVPDPSIFILLQSNERVQREGNRLVNLAARMPSKIRIFRPNIWAHREHNENFMLVDDTGFVYRKWYTRLDGRVEFHNPNRARELARFFQDVWNESDEDIALRRLST
jgi:predicted GNAT family N-acyltransferase